MRRRNKRYLREEVEIDAGTVLADLGIGEVESDLVDFEEGVVVKVASITESARRGRLTEEEECQIEDVVKEEIDDLIDDIEDINEEDEEVTLDDEAEERVAEVLVDLEDEVSEILDSEEVPEDISDAVEDAVEDAVDEVVDAIQESIRRSKMKKLKESRQSRRSRKRKVNESKKRISRGRRVNESRRNTRRDRRSRINEGLLQPISSGYEFTKTDASGYTHKVTFYDLGSQWKVSVYNAIDNFTDSVTYYSEEEALRVAEDAANELDYTGDPDIAQAVLEDSLS